MRNAPATPSIPVVQPAAEPAHFEDPVHVSAESWLPPPLLVGLSLLPWGVPFLWAILLFAGAREPVFSFATPVAVAVGVSGLCFGVAFAGRWSTSTRAKAIVAVALIGFASGGVLYSIKKEWIESIRRQFGRGDLRWREFQPPDAAYKVKLPAPALPTESPLPGWPLTAFRAAEQDRAASDSFVVAHGKPPAGNPPPNAADDAWFDATKAAVIAASGGRVEQEKPLRDLRGNPGREYALTLGDGATNRVVRVYRIGERAFYLAAEGAFLPQNGHDVEVFFGSFYVRPK